MFRSALAFAALSLSIASLVGCSADSEKVEESTSNLKNDSSLVGSYSSDKGAFRGLILDDKRIGMGSEFIADVDTGIKCITVPCPTRERVVGTYTIEGSAITFSSDSVTDFASHVLGTYTFKVQNKRITLSRKGESQTLEVVNSYCVEEADCYSQRLAHAECIGGGFSCNAKRSCEWTCEGDPRQPTKSEPVVDACATLDEETCMGNKGCEAMFGPSTCSGDGYCTTDLVFNGCKLR